MNNNITLQLPHTQGKKNEYRITCYNRATEGKYKVYGEYVCHMAYVHYNRVGAAVNWLRSRGYKFNRVKIYHRKTNTLIQIIDV